MNEMDKLEAAEEAVKREREELARKVEAAVAPLGLTINHVEWEFGHYFTARMIPIRRETTPWPNNRPS